MTREEILRPPTQLEKIIGCLLGVLLGDALGMPWEMMSAKEIMLATRGKGVLTFSKPIQTKIHDTMFLQPGEFTDDYQLTRAITRSLIRCHRFDLIDCLKAHLDELNHSDTGFGKSTKENLLVLKDLFAVTDKISDLPQTSDLLGPGAGNGIGMKVAPLGLFFCEDPEAMFEAVRKIGSATHKDPQAYLAGQLIAKAVSLVFKQSIGFCSKDEMKPQIAGLASDLIAEIVVREHNLWGDRRSDLHKAMLELGRMVKGNQLADANNVAKTFGKSCYCAESIPFSIAMFLRHPTNFKAAVLETINCGGDTDSNASMVGAMVGANLGVMEIPQDWRTFRPTEYREAYHLGKGLFEVMGLSK